MVFADVAPGTRVLDVGCGTGAATAAAVEAVGLEGLAAGIDLSEPMLRAGRVERPDLVLAVGDVVDLPFLDGAFDVVTSSFSLHVLRDLRGGLFDMIRVLKPGGRLGATVWADGPSTAPDDLHAAWNELVLEVVNEELLADVVAQAVPGRFRLNDRNTLETTLIDAGLRHVRTERREYRFDYPLDDFVEGLATMSVGRFVHEMLGDQSFASFMSRAKDVYRDRFADLLHDFADLWLVVATKER